ncbi:MAG: class I SAM-dependent methyltransferase [Bacteroidetes bacterium]|nr:class I SAM-dependent methyltransferase [Bacteroidota bacterium]
MDELTFHDRDRNRNFIDESKTNDNYERFYGNRKYYSTIKRSNDFVEKWIQNEAVGKIFLDYACGNGNQALLAAKNGAALSIGLDISKVSVKNALVAAKNKNIKINQKGGVCFFQADAENTKLPDCCIDTIICSGMLHHLDLSYAFPELRRILKPGGKILAVEALDYNPAIKLYRMLTPSMRTDWEKAHILSLRDIRFAKRFFYVEKIHYWHITAYIGGKFPFLFPVFDFIDKIFENIPYLQRMAWIFTFVLRKK